METKDLKEECNCAIPGSTHRLEQRVRLKLQADKAHKKQIATKIASVPWTEADDKRLAMLVQRTVVNALPSLHPSKHVCGPCDLVHTAHALQAVCFNTLWDADQAAWKGWNRLVSDSKRHARAYVAPVPRTLLQSRRRERQ